MPRGRTKCQDGKRNAARADKNAEAANANARRADENARKAENETKEAETQLLRARTAEYAAKIGVAQRDIAEGDVTHAEALLGGCASDLRGWEYRYVWTNLRKRRIVLSGHTDPVWSVAFSPDGGRIVSCSGPDPSATRRKSPITR